MFKETFCEVQNRLPRPTNEFDWYRYAEKEKFFFFFLNLFFRFGTCRIARGKNKLSCRLKYSIGHGVCLGEAP